jgi:TIR domain
MGRAIFISYRRDDTEGEAGRLFDDLVRSFGDNSVFMDVSGINPGVDFRKAIDDNVASCGVLLAVIGPQWSSITDSSGGGRRLDDPNDFVRLEIASALAREIAVIPVLVHDAKMPRPDGLPENLKNLAFRNSVEITHTRWNSDVQLLTEALKRYVAPTAATDTAPVHATVAVQLPPPTPSAQKSDSGRPSNIPLMLGIAAAAVVALGVVGFLVFHGTGNSNNPTPAPVPAPIPAPAPVNSAYLGTWVNPASEGKDGINRLEISASGSNQLSVHAWGKCTPEDCDWGTQTATMDGQQATSNWNLPGTNKKGTRTAAVAIKPLGGELSVTVSNTYSDHAPTQREFIFLKAQ